MRAGGGRKEREENKEKRRQGETERDRETERDKETERDRETERDGITVPLSLSLFVSFSDEVFVSFGSCHNSTNNTASLNEWSKQVKA